jgi:signal peptidase II
MTATASARSRAVLIIALVIVLDRVTKILIRDHFSMWDSHAVIAGFFNIVHVENPGAAFGMFSDATGAWKTIFLVGVSVVEMIVIGIILWRITAQTPRLNLWMQTGLALVFGGAFGNFWDRAFAEAHTVTDFLQFFFGSYEYPSFNAADSAISVGAVLLLIDLWRSRNASPSVVARPAQ